MDTVQLPPVPGPTRRMETRAGIRTRRHKALAVGEVLLVRAPTVHKLEVGQVLSKAGPHGRQDLAAAAVGGVLKHRMRMHGEVQAHRVEVLWAVEGCGGVVARPAGTRREVGRAGAVRIVQILGGMYDFRLVCFFL